MAYILIVAAGLRKSECLGLRWQDVFVEECYISIVQTLMSVRKTNPTETEKRSTLIFQLPKTQSSIRKIPIPVNVMKSLLYYKEHIIDREKQLLDDAYQDFDLVFCTENGKPIEPRILTESSNQF